MLQLATSFDQVTLTGTLAADNVFTLTIDPTPGDADNDDAVMVEVTAQDGDTINDIRDALVDAVNNHANLQGVAQASATSGSGGFVVAATTSGNSIGVTVTENGDATGAESASTQILNALAAADAAKTTIEDLLADGVQDGDGDATATALDTAVTALDAAIAATRQTVSVTIGGTVEAGDTLTVAFDTNNDGTPDVTKTITVGANPTLASVRDALVNQIGTAGGMTASTALQDGELVLISDDPNASFIRVTVSAVNEDGVAGEAPTISAARTGTEAALRALKNGLLQASAVADVIEAVVDIAGTAAGTARAAADGLAPAFDTNDALTAESAATIVTTANTLGSLSPALDPSVPADVVTAAQLLAEIAEGYVPDALSGAATANAQATIAQQAAFQAASGLAQFEQAILKARNEAELRIQQEARDSAPVASDDVIGDGDATNGGPVSGDDEVLEDQAITFDVLGNDKRADGGDLTNAAIAAVGQPAHGKITIVAEVKELNFGPTNIADGDTITLTVNGVSVTYTMESTNAELNADQFVALINSTPAMAAVVSAAEGSRGGALTLTSAVPGTPIVTSVAVDGNFDADVDTVIVPNGRVTYTPDANYSGTDTFTYTVSNGANPPSFDTATVTIDITPTNDNPDAKNDFVTTANDSTAISKTAAAGLLANDTDIDTGDSLSIIKVNGSTVGVAQNVNFTLPNGDPVVAQVTINADGSYTVNPNGQFEPLAAGQSATGTLTYTVSDGHAGTDDQTIALTNPVANATGVNQVSPYVIGGTIERGDVFEVTVNGTRISHTVTNETTANEVRDAVVAKLNANGVIAGKVTASAGGGGEVVITANLAGQAFTSSAQAINAGTDVATLTVTITGSNDAPTADADTASGDEDTTITGTLTANDPDLGDTLTFAVAGGGQAANGTVTVQSNGNFSYVPNAEFSGTDSFTFRVTDSAGIASTATVTITVNNVNDDPIITVGGDPAPTFEEGGNAVIVDGALSITDVDTANFNTGSLRAAVTGNLNAGDALLVQETGGITLSGTTVLFNGVSIGTIDGTYDGSAGDLLITLDSDATPAAVQALARTIAFTNDADTPATVARTVTFTVDSGDGGTATQDVTVQVALESGLTRSDHDQLNFSSDWFDAANWTSGIPDATTIAVINDGGYAPITFNNGPVNETVGQLVVNADLNILAGTLNMLEPSAVEQGATVTVSNASVLGTGDLNIAGTVALSGAATLGLPLISLAAIANDSIAGGMTVTGSGNQINGALAIEADSVYVGQLILGGTGSGNVTLDVTLGIVNAGAIVIDNFDAAPADAILTVGDPGIANTGTITFSDTSGGGGQRVIEGSIDTANGTITVETSATIDLAGGILNAAAGTIDLATATVLTVNGGQTIIDGDTYLSGTGALDLAGTGGLTLASDFALNPGNPELTLSGAIIIDGDISGEAAPTFTIGDGRSLTLDGDTVSDTVSLAVDGTLTIEGTGTVIAAPTTINSPNGAFTVAPGATVTITAPGFIFNDGGVVSVGAGGTLILDGVNIENTGLLTGEGTIQLANGADIAGEGIIDVAGVDNIGTLNITGGEVVFDTNSILDIDIGGGASDVLHLDTMDLTAAGDTLNLTFAPGFDPTVDGNSFQILTYSSHTAEIGGDGGVLEAGIDNIFDTIEHNLGPEYTVTIDYGSTAATVTVNRNPEIAVTTNGAGMQFDGVDDYITIPTDPAIINAASITVEAVVNLAGPPAQAVRIAENFNSDYAGWGFTIETNGALIVQLGDGGTDSQLSSFTTVPGVVIPDQPTHVAFTYDGPSGEIVVYVNGVAVDGTPGGVNPENNLGNATQDVAINHPVFPLKGSIDEFRIYNEARTANEVASDAGGGTDGTQPLVHFDFADGQAINLGSLGSASDGNLGNALDGPALAFDGSDDLVQSDTAGIDFGNAFSIEFVVQTEMAATGYIMTIGDTFSGGVPANNLLFANIPSAAGNLRIGQFGVVDIDSTTLVNDGVPHHVSLTHDGAGNYSLYIDGVLENTAPGNPLPDLTGSTLMLGNPTGVPAFNGAVGDFRIYSDERNATEVAADATGAVDTDNLQIHYAIDAADVADGTITNQGVLGSSADATVGTITGSDAADPTVIDITNPTAPLAVPLVGQALSFDGIDDRIEVTDPPRIMVNATDQSSGFVITNATANGSDDTITDFGNTPGTFAGFEVGDVVTLTGFSNGSNNVTGTITAVAPDGSSISFADGTLGANNGMASAGTIETVSSSPLATGTDAFSHQLWFRTDTTGLRQELFEVLSDGTLNEGALLFVNADNKLGFDLSAAAGISGQGPVVADGLWHHAAVTFDGTTTTLFVDGVAIGSTTSLTPNLVEGNVNIGAGQGGALPFQGEIFDVRAYDVARTAGEIRADMNDLPDGTDPTLTGAWHLDDVLNGTMGQFRDVTGNGGTGTFTGGTPVFVDNNLFTMAEDSVLHGRITGTDVDNIAETFIFGVAAQGTNGTVTVNPTDGTWEYTPDADFVGTDTFEVQVTDSLGATATKTVSVNVLNVNDAPVVANPAVAPIENFGTIADDVINGGAGDDILRGKEGDDVIDGGAGSDIIIGGFGADTLTGGAGQDAFLYGVGESDPGTADVITDFTVTDDIIVLDQTVLDTLGFSFTGVDGGHTASDGYASASITASGSDSILTIDADDDGVVDGEILLLGVNAAEFSASNIDNLFFDTSQFNVITGTDGIDAPLTGTGGLDFLIGRDGDDTLLGGGGALDLFDGGLGADVMTGGGAAGDYYLYRQTLDSTVGNGDTITTFNANVDVIDLQAIISGDFDFNGAGAFSGGGTASASFDGSLLQIDADGNGVADMEMTLSSVTGSLSLANFLTADGEATTVIGTTTFAEDGIPVLVNEFIQITDGDSFDLDGGSLTIQITGGFQAGDVLAVEPGLFDVLGGAVSIDQDLIGSIIEDGTTGTLRIDLTDSATPEIIELLARSITFENTAAEPGAGARTIDFTLSDGDGGTSAALSQTVNITPVNDAPEVTTATLPAGTATFDAEVLVNTALTGEQSAADVTYFAGGTKFVATWNNYSVGGGSDLGAIGRIFNADGTPDGPEFVIANTVPGSEYNARVSPMADGGFIISYVNQPTAADANTSDLYVQRYDSTGQAVSRDGSTPGADAFNVGEYFSGTVQNGGTVVGLSNGGFVIAIDQQDSGIASGQDVTARVFGANGLPVTGEFLLGSSPTPATQGTELAALPGGGFVAVWTDNTDGDNDLFARVYDNSGTPLGPEFAVAVNQGGGTQQDQHEVAALSNGNFAVAWRTDDISSGDNDGAGGIGYRIFGPDGTPVTSDLLANTDITGHQNEPSIAALPDGGFVVSWSTNDTAADGDGTAIRAQRFDAAGAKVGTEFTVNENTAGNQQQAAIAADADGNLVAVFRQSDPVGATADNTEIGARVISFGLDGKTYVEDGAPLLVDSGITLTDLDSTTLDGATVTITTAFEANTDILSFTPVGSIGGSYDAATGALTLTGTGTVAEYEQVLRSVAFNSTAVQPDLADRIIEFQITDDQGAPSTPFAVTIGVENINDAPEISSAGGNATFTEDGPAVAIDTAIVIIDIDSTDFDLGQFTATITAGGTTDDVLDIDTSGNIGLSAGLTPASVVSVSGTDIGLVNAASTAGNIIIDLDPDATPALVQELARAVTYQNISEEPGVAQRTVTFQVSDGDGGVSAAFDRTVDISPVNDAPEILGVVQSSNVAQFDGSGDSISLANPAGLPNGASDFTWSAWVKTDATGINHAILSIGNATGTGTNGQLFIQGSGQLAFDSLNVGFTTGGPAINDDVWHHVAVTTSGGYSEIFLDGVSVAAPIDLSLAIGTDSAYIGQAPGGINQFQGEISDVRIYDVARTADDIAADMSLRLTGAEPNLVAYYPLDSETGGIVVDLAGGDNVGTLLGDVTIGGSSPDFLIDTATVFADDFNDGTLDPAAFTVDTASSGATAAEAGGALALGNRAIVTTTAEYEPTATEPVIINTSFTFQDTANDFFSIVTRSDGVADSGNFYQVTNGISFVTQAAGDNKLAILRYENGVGTGLGDSGVGSIILTNGTTYDVQIADDGYNLTFTVTEAGNPANTATLTAQDSTLYAENHVSLYNREVVANGPQIDSLEITQPGGLLVVPEDGSFSSQIVAGDLDNGPGDLSFTLDVGAAHGTVDVQPDGTFTYTPNPDYAGSDSFTVTVDDGAGGTNTRTILLDVQNTNDAPVILGAPTNVNTPQFNGIDDFVQATNPAALLPSGNAPFTIEAWVQPAEAGTLASLGTATGNQGLEIFITESGELGVGTDDRTTIEIVDTGNAIDDGAWHHVAVAYDGTTFRLYVDGVETASGNGALNVDVGGEFIFGKGFNDTGHFKGAIDDIRIWADERTAQEIADNHQQADLADTTGLAARYTLDNTDEADIDPALIDISGNGHVITSGGPPSDPFGAYAVLDGAGDMVNFTQIAPVDGTNKITIAAWVRPDDLTGTQAIAAIGAGGLVLELDGNGLSFTNAGVTGTGAGGNLTAGEWNHVAVTYDGDTGAFETFVNGVSQGSSNIGTSTLPAATTMAIGSSTGDGNETATDSFSGAVAQLRIFDEVRQATDIQADMALSHYDGQPPATLLIEQPLDRHSSDASLVGDAHIADHSPTLLGSNVTSGAISFDGIDDEISIYSNPGLDPDSWTVETWLRSDADDNAAGVQRLLTLSNGTHAAYSLLFQNGNLSVEFTHQGGASSSFVTAVDDIRDGLWHHAAGTYDSASNTLSLFVDGHLVGQIDTTGYTPSDGNADLVIGNFTTSHDQRFTGEMADMRIWEYARDEWQIANDLEEPVSPDSPGLVANFPLNGGTGGRAVPATIFDVVDGLTGNVYGAPVFVDTGPGIYSGLDPSTPLAGTEDTILRGRIVAEDVDGDSLTFTLNVSPNHGSVTLNSDGSYEYNPYTDQFGTDSFTVTVDDGFGGTDTRTIYLDLAPVTDVFIGGNGDDLYLFGTDGDDILDGRTGENVMSGGGGDDYLTGGTRGKGGVDRNIADYYGVSAGITVDASTDTVTGDASVGTDTLGNIDQIIGSAHNDLFDMTGWDNSQFDAFDPDGSGGLTPTVGVFNAIRGGDGDDTITGNGYTRADYGDAYGGVTATLTGATDGSGYGHRTSNNAGSDGGEGGLAALGLADGTGLDTFISGVNELAGSDYDDILTGNDNNNVLIGRGGYDTLDGGLGMDRADYRSDTYGITVTYDPDDSFNATVIDGLGDTDTLISIEQVRGSQFDDVFNGNDADNRFRGEGGADTFNLADDASFVGISNGGDDRIEYTRGDESTLPDGFDNIIGFTTGDTIRFNGMDGLELMTVGYAYAGTVQTTVDAIAIDDGVQDRVTFFTDGVDGYLYVKGRGTGTTNYDGTLIKLQGITAPLAGTDVRGANGTALIETTDGTNTIIATAAQETHTGGTGPNYFVFTAVADSATGAGNRDTIDDFVVGVDKIVLEGLVDDGDEFTLLAPGLDLLGNGNATAAFGTLGLSNVLQIDLDGDFFLGTGIDMQIDLPNVDRNALTTDDFIIITTSTGTDIDDTYNGRAGNDWILASTTNAFVMDIASAAVTTGDTITLAGGSDGIDTLIIRDPMEFIGAEWSGTDLMLFYEDIGSTYVHKTTVTNHAANSLDYIEFEFNDGDALDRFAVANGSDASGGTENTLVAGGSGIDTLIGSDHNDILLGNDGDDDLSGGDGDDLLIGGAGEDILDGGAGNDTVSYFQNPTNGVIVNLSNTTEGISPEAISGGTAFDPYSAEIDTLSNIENAEGSSFDDFLIGSDVTNRLSGDDGNDTIYGGGGADILEGGEGMDVFIYNSPSDSGIGGLLRDVILDFDAIGADKIDISAFNEGMFMFVGDDTNDFAGYGASSARFNNETKILEIDADGDAQADMEIELQNVDGADLDSNDFMVSGGQVA